MKERPILFNSEMVRAILEGRKTQTRRVVKGPWLKTVEECMRVNGKWVWETMEYSLTTPFGEIGDRLWVRETWTNGVGSKEREVFYRATEENKPTYAIWRPSIHMPRWASRITLEITEVRVERLQDISEEDAKAEGMVRGSAGWSHDVVKADDPGEVLGTARNAFGSLINQIHGGKNWNFWYSWPDKYPEPIWEQNPWVWVIEFKRVQQ